MGEVVGIKPTPTRDDLDFVREMARYSEGLTDELAIRKKYRLADDVWTALASDDDLVRAITDETLRRVRDGSAKREKAQKLVVAAPDVLSEILLAKDANPRHRIDSCKVLNDLAANGPEAAPAADRFIIRIDIKGDVLHFDKPIAIDASPQRTIDDAPQDEWLPVLTTNKPKDDDQW